MDKRKIDVLLKIYDGVYRGILLFNIIFFFWLINIFNYVVKFGLKLNVYEKFFEECIIWIRIIKGDKN